MTDKPDTMRIGADALLGVAQGWAAGDTMLFDAVPVSMWLLNCSELKAHFDSLRRQGVDDLAAWLEGNPTRVMQCLRGMRVVKGNLFSRLPAAAKVRQFQRSQSVASIAADPDGYTLNLVKLWNGEVSFGSRANMQLATGGEVDVHTRAVLLPGHEQDWACVLMLCEDISEQQATRRQLSRNEAYVRTVFEHSPTSLWIEDFSAIKKSLDRLRANGIEDLRKYLDENPEFVKACMADIRIVDINAQTLVLFGAPDKETFRLQVHAILRDATLLHFKEELVTLWQGALRQQHEARNYTLSGEPLDLVLQLSVMPGHEHDWSLILVALTDITARKRAETALAFLGRHDAQTGLMNRSFYVEEIERLERHGAFPITVIIADLNGLKTVNDKYGHAAGDALLKRAADLFLEALPDLARAARIGGDEFAILLPATRAEQGEKIIARIKRLVAQSNRQFPLCELSLSMGMATSEVSQLEDTIHRADLNMYAAERAFYTRFPALSRRVPAVADQ